MKNFFGIFISCSKKISERSFNFQNLYYLLLNSNDSIQNTQTYSMKSIYSIKKIMAYYVELDANTDITVFELITRNRIDTFAVYYSKIINDELQKITFGINKINSKTLVSKTLDNRDTSYNVGDINLFFR
ncbi:MAG: hypothetical protein HQ463_07690 [Bacteroidetes bacterium]|nr:hypothetical protein [Bacteroidota bacterium]